MLIENQSICSYLLLSRCYIHCLVNSIVCCAMERSIGRESYTFYMDEYVCAHRRMKNLFKLQVNLLREYEITILTSSDRVCIADFSHISFVVHFHCCHIQYHTVLSARVTTTISTHINEQSRKSAFDFV